MGRKNIEVTEKPRLSDEMLEKIIIKAVLLFFMAVLVYIPAMNGGYIYDDDNLLYHNPAIRRGVGWNSEAWKGLWAFWYPVGVDAAAAADYAPLADTTLWLEWRFWGNNGDLTGPELDPNVKGIGAPGYHIDNVVLHGIAALLLWYLLAQIGIPGAWVAALVWAVHPVCAESVAWISERRNTLSMVLFALTMINWFNFQRTRRWGIYSLVLFLFVLTMFAKTSIVMLPFVLILCVWWLRNRVTEKDLWEAAPFFVVSFIFGVITLYFQNYRAINKEQVFIVNPFERITGACYALGFYFYKILLPINLNLIYQQWHRTLPHAGASTESILFALNAQASVPYSIIGIAKELIIGLDFAAFFYWAWLRRATWGRHAIFGMGFFVLMIAPVLGFTRMAYMRLTLVSDHFQYVPMVGVIALCVAGLAEVHKRLQPSLRPVLAAVGAGFIVIFCCLTWQRAVAFSEPENLWRDNLRKNPDSWQGHSHLGAILWQRGDVPGAMQEWEQSVEFAPYLYETHNNYALALNKSGDQDVAHKQAYMDAALNQFKIAVGIDPTQFNVRTNYANALLTAGQFEEINKNFQQAAGYYNASLEQYLEVLKYYGGNPDTYVNMGLANFQLGRLDDAIKCFEAALQIVKNYPSSQIYINIQHDLEMVRARRQQELEAPAPQSQNQPPAPAPSPSKKPGSGGN